MSLKHMFQFYLKREEEDEEEEEAANTCVETVVRGSEPRPAD
jgi:hypothetical protein